MCFSNPQDRKVPQLVALSTVILRTKYLEMSSVDDKQPQRATT